MHSFALVSTLVLASTFFSKAAAGLSHEPYTSVPHCEKYGWKIAGHCAANMGWLTNEGHVSCCQECKTGYKLHARLDACYKKSPVSPHQQSTACLASTLANASSGAVAMTTASMVANSTDTQVRVEGRGSSVSSHTSSANSTTTPTTTPASSAAATKTTSAKAVSKATTATTSAKTTTAVTTSRPTTTTTSASTSAPSTGKKGKKGLGYTNASYLDGFSSSISWAYNWGNSGSVPAGVEYVPMLWGTDATNWATNARAAIANGSTHLLGFNEPDLGAQSNISPATAASLWQTNMEPFASSARLVSPAVTNGGSPMGVAWLQDFVAACSGCHIDAFAMHWYDKTSNTDYFKQYFTSAYATLGKPIWITEFEGLGTDAADQEAFIQEIIPWLDEQTFIERYAYFGDFAGDMVSSTGDLTALGQAYRDA